MQHFWGRDEWFGEASRIFLGSFWIRFCDITSLALSHRYLRHQAFAGGEVLQRSSGVITRSGGHFQFPGCLRSDSHRGHRRTNDCTSAWYLNAVSGDSQFAHDTPLTRFSTLPFNLARRTLSLPRCVASSSHLKRGRPISAVWRPKSNCIGSLGVQQ